MTQPETGYLTPTTPQEAVEMLRGYAGHARVIAGGTDILPDVAKGALTAGQAHAPDCLIDITRIPELGKIEVGESWVIVGAAVPFVRLREHPYLASRFHALVDAAASVGALAIQTSATWAGNLVQALPAADGAIIAAALDAEVRVLVARSETGHSTVVRSETGHSTVEETGHSTVEERWLPVADLYAGPGRSRIDSTRELVTHIRFPIPVSTWGPPCWGTAWRRAGRRPSLVLPTLNCAVKVELERDRILPAAGVAIAMGPVGPCPVRAHSAEVFLAGKEPRPEVLAEAAQLALCDADPRSSVLRASREYRLAVLPVLVEDALTRAVRRARGVQD
ncbi:MAG: FAD binding domain-containing protein [Nitrososphaerales archaeon]